MNPIKRFFWALGGTLLAQSDTLIGTLVAKPLREQFHATAATRLGPPQQNNGRLASYRSMVRSSVDGCILEGSSSQAWAKYAIPKGLPAEASTRRLAVENEPHTVDDFDGEISSGYGKGTKTLLASETVMVKVGGKTFPSRLNYHFHEADVAGPHYDLVVENVAPGTKQWELHIPRGEFKGRYAFNTTTQGIIIVPMKDHCDIVAKPPYQLKPIEFLDQIALRPDRYEVTRKGDGSLGNVTIHKARAAFRSHREGANVYYDRLPGLEFVSNKSRCWSCRKLFPGPNQEGTQLQGELMHSDGVARVSGILNALPERARQTQELRGNVTYCAWDIKKFRGKDVSDLPYADRRTLLKKTIEEIRLFNKNWDLLDSPKRNETPRQFYDRVISDPRGLPYSEGVVIKDLADPSGETWFKVKHRDLEDFQVVSIHPSEPGTKYANSAAWMVVRDPVTGNEGKVGSFAVSDPQRQWIFDHRDELVGAVAKVSVMEKTETGLPRAGTFIEWHGDPRFGGAGSEMALYMYSEALAGGDPVEGERMKYRLISSAGWKK